MEREGDIFRGQHSELEASLGFGATFHSEWHEAGLKYCLSNKDLLAK